MWYYGGLSDKLDDIKLQRCTMFCNGVAPAHEHGFFIIVAGNSGKAKHCLIPDEGVLKRCLRFG